jgi:hypothetical protein
VRYKLDHGRFSIEAFGHTCLTGKDQAAPASSEWGVALAYISREKLIVRRTLLEQDRRHAQAILKAG